MPSEALKHLVFSSKARQIEQELDRAHERYELYHRATVQMDIMTRYDLSNREFDYIFNNWLTRRQHGK
jgi:hypothetical protein